MIYKQLTKFSPDLGTGGTSLNQQPDQVDPKPDPEPEQKPELNLQAVKTFLESNPDGRSYVQALNQDTIDASVIEIVEKEREAIKAKAILEAKNMTPEQLRQRENEARVAELEAQIKMGDNKTLAIQTVTSMDLDKSVQSKVLAFAQESLVASSAEQTNANLQNLNYIIDKVKESAIRDSQIKAIDKVDNKQISPTLGSQPQQSQGITAFEANHRASSMIGDILKG